MQLPEICIKRPVFATVLSMIVLLVGLISYTRLPVREYPRIDDPVVSVSVTYRGASAEVVESQVTKPLEDSLAGIEGVEVMTSQSRSESSRINVRFTLKRDPDSAAADVRDGSPRQPVARVHVDHTERSGPQRVRDLIPDEAEELLKGRVQIINLWRPIKGPLLDSPLAVCDARTVKSGDLVASDLVYPNRIGETYSVKYNPDHQWFYVPKMTADEILLLKCFDSKTDGSARFAPHSAFADPTTPPGAPPRESIELRTLVFHKN